MTYTELKQFIDTNIYPNANEEISAQMTNDAITALINKIKDDIGDVADLQEQGNLVEVINIALQNSSEDFDFAVHYGQNNPNDAPPTNFNIGDFYVQNNDKVYQFSSGAWVLVENVLSGANLKETLDFGNTAEKPIIYKALGNDGEVLEIGDIANGFFGNLFVKSAKFKGGNPETMQAWEGEVVDAMSGLSVLKNPSNGNNHIEKNDFATGWIGNLFVNGIYKKTGMPTMTDLSDYRNWSNSLEL